MSSASCKRQIGRSALLWVVLGSVPLLGAPAYGAKPKASAVKAAQIQIDRGRDLFQQGRYVEAIVEFTAAMSVVSNPALLWNIARANEEAGNIEQAIEFFRRYAEASITEDERKAADERISKLAVALIDSRAVTVTVVTSRDDAQVFAGDDLVGTGREVVARLAPGPQKIRVKAERFAPYEANLELAQGGAVRVVADLVPIVTEGTLVVQTNLAESSILVDDRPVAQGTRINLAAGPHVVRISAQGWVAEQRRIDVVAGRELALEVSLQPEALIGPDEVDLVSDRTGSGPTMFHAAFPVTSFRLLTHVAVFDAALTDNATGLYFVPPPTRQDALASRTAADTTVVDFLLSSTFSIIDLIELDLSIPLGLAYRFDSAGEDFNSVGKMKTNEGATNTGPLVGNLAIGAYAGGSFELGPVALDIGGGLTVFCPTSVAGGDESALDNDRQAYNQRLGMRAHPARPGYRSLGAWTWSPEFTAALRWNILEFQVGFGLDIMDFTRDVAQGWPSDTTVAVHGGLLATVVPIAPLEFGLELAGHRNVSGYDFSQTQIGITSRARWGETGYAGFTARFPVDPFSDTVDVVYLVEIGMFDRWRPF